VCGAWKEEVVAVSTQVTQYAQRRVTRKLIRAVPFLGALVALVTLGRAIRRKGVLGGSVDTALDFTPFVGGVKNAAEIVRGRDLIRDKATAPASRG
jgi:hypothetical protein